MRLLCPAPGTNANSCAMLRNQPSDLKSLSDTPKILILAGPNGAGKTTFAREFVRKELGFKHLLMPI